RELLHEPPELLPALLEALELVERRARRREDDDVAVGRGGRGLRDRLLERPGADEGDTSCLQGRRELLRGVPDEVRAVVSGERPRERVVRLVLPEPPQD